MSLGTSPLPSLPAVSTDSAPQRTLRERASSAVSSIRNSGLSAVENTVGRLSGGVGQFVNNLGQEIATQIPQVPSLDNIMSLIRGLNLPSLNDTYISSGTPTRVTFNASEDWRVRINANWESFFPNPLFELFIKTGGLVFPVLPQITFSSSAEYDTINPAHSNYTFYSYKNSKIADIFLQATFYAETAEDAAYWVAATTFFRTATKMYFGQGENVGNPPPICQLSGYGPGIFDKVPVIVKSFDMSLPSDVNYVKCDKFNINTWVPIRSEFTIELGPVYNRERQRQFNLNDFAKGALIPGNAGDGIRWI
jgi:hypothetical protein